MLRRNPAAVELLPNHSAARPTTNGPQSGGQARIPGFCGAKRDRINIGNGGQQPALPSRHWPGGNPLIEKGTAHADQERVDERIGVERGIDGEDQVFEPHRRLGIGHRTARERDAFHAGVPQIGSLCLVSSPPLRERPPHCDVRFLPDRMLHQCQLQRPHRHPPARQRLAPPIPQFVVENRLHICHADPPPGQFPPVDRLRQEWLRAVHPRSLHHRRFKRLSLKSLQDVLGDKDADGALGGEVNRSAGDRLLDGTIAIVREAIACRGDGMVKIAGHRVAGGRMRRATATLGSWLKYPINGLGKRHRSQAPGTCNPARNVAPIPPAPTAARQPAGRAGCGFGSICVSLTPACEEPAPWTLRRLPTPAV